MALFEMIIKSVYAGQQCINRWNYASSGTPAAVSLSFALASAAGCIPAGEPPVFPADTMFDKIRKITATNVEFREVIVNNVYTLTDFYTTAFPDNTNGSAGGGAANQSFVASGFRTNQTRRDVGRGFKRFVGVPDGFTGVNNSLNPTHLEAMNILRAAMSANLTYNDEGNTITFNPVICSKDKVTLPSGRFTYRYYPTLTEQMNHTATGILWEIYDTTRSQTSRQIGKGN